LQEIFGKRPFDKEETIVADIQSVEKEED